MFYQIAENFKLPFTPFSLFPTIARREAWASLDEEWQRETILLGETYLSYPFVSISATDFMEFLRTGNRVSFEEKSFSKRCALNALVLAECAENKGRFLDDIINGIFSLCEESAWQLPAHNSYVRDQPQLLLPDVTKPVLDLFACETGSILAVICYLLENVLDAVSPVITKRIRHELKNRIFLPYLNHHFWWMGNGKDSLNNWTVWCTQNILISTFLAGSEESEKYNIFQKTLKSIDFFLAEYEEDGCCDEGPQYYRHAGLCLFNVIEILNAVTHNAFISLYDNPKIKNIASYILNVHIHDKYYINFADSSPVAGRSGVREFLFGKRISNQELTCFAAADFKAGLPDTMLLPKENNLFYRVQNGFAISGIKAYDTSRTIIHPDIFYSSTGIFSVRDEHLLIAVKAGNNGDSHNHNDTGSFLVYKDGEPMIIDVGVESYTKKTFSPERYEIWTMQSAYHNLPTINGYMQKAGEQYCAEGVSYTLDASGSEIRMDIASAYPLESNLLFYQRHARLVKGKEIIIDDCFAFGLENVSSASLIDPTDQVILSLLTYEKPVLLDSASLSVGNLGMINMKGWELLEIEEIPITDPRLMTAWEHEIYRILLKASENCFFCSLIIK